MAQNKRRNPRDEEFDKELEWLVVETGKLEVDVRAKLMQVLRSLLDLARGPEARPPSGEPVRPPRKRLPPM